MKSRYSWFVPLCTLLMILTANTAGADSPMPPPPTTEMGVVETPLDSAEKGGSIPGLPSNASSAKTTAAVGPLSILMRDIQPADQDYVGGPLRSHIQGEPLFADGLGPLGTSETSGDFIEGSAPSEERAPGDSVFEWDGLAATGWIPPDTVSAVGPSHVIEATNSGFAIYSKLGDQKQAYTSFSSFFNSLKPTGWTGFMYDPRVMWSNEHHKFVMLALGKDIGNQTSHFFLAVSQSSDPLGSWWRWRFDRTNTGGDTDAWLDYAGLGADTWGIYVTGNMFYWVGGFKYSILHIVNVDAFSGGVANGWIWSDLQWPSTAKAFGVQPALPQTVNSNGETYFVNTWNGWGSGALLWKLAGDRTWVTAPTLTRTEVTGLTNYYSLGENVVQQGTTARIDGGDSRVMNAVYDNRRVIFALTNDFGDDASHSAAHTISLNSDTNVLAFEDLVAAPTGGYYFFPAVTTDANGGTNEVVTYFNYSDGSHYVSAARKHYDDWPTSGTGPNNFIEMGQGSYEARDSNNRNRWGDYSGAGFDWTCGHAFGALEYAGTSNTWRTRIQAETFGTQSQCQIIDLRNPDGGGTFIAGNTYTITWASDNLESASDLYVELDADGAGGAWDQQIAGAISTGTTSTSWTVPNIDTSSARVFVGRWSGATWTVGDRSDLPFTIDGCTLDAYEPDGSSGTASLINPGSQNHTICDSQDEDWVRFTLGAPAAVTLETSGPNGDTEMWLYNSALTQIDYDDQSGAGNFSKIERTCGVDELPAGTYYLKVDEWLQNSHIDAYSITFSTTPCSGADLIFSDGFESGNTNAWSSTSP